MDDYLAACSSIDSLLHSTVSLDTYELLRPRHGQREPLYAVTDEGVVWIKRTNEGTVPVPLANFAARITADITRDDGVETTRMYALEAVLRKRPHTFTVPASGFAAMNWVGEQLGATAIVEPGQGLKDRL